MTRLFGNRLLPAVLLVAALGMACSGKSEAPSPATTPSVAGTETATNTPARTPRPSGEAELAYLRSRGATTGYLLRLVRDDGSNDRQVADNVLGFNWAPSGDFIAYWTSQGEVFLAAVTLDGVLGEATRIGVGDTPVFDPKGSMLAYRQPNVGGLGSTIAVVSTVRPGAPAALVDEGPPAPEIAGKAGPTEWDWYALGWSSDVKLLLVGSPVAAIGASGNRGYHFFVFDRSLRTLTELPSGNLFGGQPHGIVYGVRDGLAGAFTSSAHISACEGEGSVVAVDPVSGGRSFKLASILPKPSPGAQVQERPYGVAWLDARTLLYSAAAFDANLCRLPQPVGPNAAGAIGGPYLFRVPLDGSSPTLLLEDAAWPAVGHSLLAFTRGVASGTPKLFVGPLDRPAAAVAIGEGEQAQPRP